MIYPTKEVVEAADAKQLGTWRRFLKSPGTSAVGTEDFKTVMKAQERMMKRICKRFDDLGGMNSKLSKEIGLDPPE